MLLGDDCSDFFIFIFIFSYFKKEGIWIYLYIKAPLWILVFFKYICDCVDVFFYLHGTV